MSCVTSSSSEGDYFPDQKRATRRALLEYVYLFVIRRITVAMLEEPPSGSQVGGMALTTGASKSDASAGRS